MRFGRRYTGPVAPVAPPVADAAAQGPTGEPALALRLRGFLLVLALLAGAGLLFSLLRSPDTLLSQPAPTPTATPATLVRISPASQSVPTGSNVVVEVRVDNVTDLGAYEFHLAFHANVLTFVSVTDFRTFLESTGRGAICTGPDAEDLLESILSFACGSIGLASGPTGSGLLARVTFSTSCAGTSDLTFVPLTGTGFLVEPVTLTNTSVDELTAGIPTRMQGGNVTVSGGAACPTPTPTPTQTATPTARPASPSPTPAASPTAGPSPTPSATPTAGPSPTPSAAPTPTEPSPPPPPPAGLGDVNGDTVVDSMDALWLLWYLAALLEPDAVPNPGGMDTNADQEVNPIDATLILQYDAGLVDRLPPGAAGGGWTATLRPLRRALAAP